MAGSTFGRLLRLTTFGESHGAGLGGILDGCPPGLELAEEDLQRDLDLRRPGQSPASTSRKEPDRVRLLSGVFQGRTTGTPIAFFVANEDQRSRDYAEVATKFRPGHADWSYVQKYRGVYDYRGGGRASGRETVARVAGGAIARKLLALRGVDLHAGAVELGGIAASREEMDLAGAFDRPYYAAAPGVVPLWDERVAEAKSAGDSLGGIVEVVATGVPAGLGEPVFDKLEALLAHGVMSVGAVKGVEVGDGFAASRATGSRNNDPLLPGGFDSNHAGGTLGGISSGQDVVVRAAVKPIASIAIPQRTLTRDGEPATIVVGGRHDVSAIPRIVPVIRAMVALVLADAMLIQARMSVLP
ncbi:MAG: chorismate synthase [Desulfovibrio sp.]|jgi:chorismate synthase|nr:chorismate synthase [Desulfovibrio sp.]